MSQERETNLALFIDFDNVALGARDARQRFDVKLLLQRVLEKGKIIVKKAYADWHHYKEHMSPLHEAAIELIEIPMPRISGKNSADIKLVVDAMDLCYSKEHIDTFVIVSGDSDFSPLVSKLRENNKRVLGIGVKNSSSHLLINNCDEFMFYDDIYRQAVGTLSRTVTHVPEDKKELFDFLVTTAQSLLQESRGVLYSSLIKDTMTRKQPDFNERNFGFSNFGELLDEARRLGLLVVERDARAGGTWVVHGLGSGGPKDGGNGEAASASGSRTSRRRRGRGGRGRTGEGDKAAKQSTEAATGPDQDESQVSVAAVEIKDSSAEGMKTAEEKAASQDRPGTAGTDEGREARAGTGETKKTTGRQAPAKKASKKASKKTTTTKKAPTQKAPTKKATTKKATTKKAPTKKAATKKPATKKAATKKAASNQVTTKKATTKKVTTKKATTKQAATKKATTKKAATKKTAAGKAQDK